MYVCMHVYIHIHTDTYTQMCNIEGVKKYLRVRRMSVARSHCHEESQGLQGQHEMRQTLRSQL